VCGVGAAEGKQLVSFYRERYTDIGIFENRVYPGVIELLEQLKQQGYVICMATSKPEIFASRIAEHFKFAKYFDIIGGSLLDGKRVKKSEVIEYVLEKAHVQAREQVLMIGDRYHDIIGAKEAKIHSMGVLYGYGDRKELEEAGAEFIASTPEEVFRMISSIA
jgi:phosphoglycolate phosphatase